MNNAKLRDELNHIRTAWESGNGGDFHRLLYVAEQLMIAAETESTERRDLLILIREAVEDDVEGPHYFGEDLWQRLVEVSGK